MSVTERSPHRSAAKVRVGRPFAAGPDPRGNAGGRPQGLARLARATVGDGEELVPLYLAVLRRDAKALGESRITLRDRIQAAEWITERGWGKPAPTLELPDEPEPPKGNLVDALAAHSDELPDDVREQIAYLVDQVFQAKASSRIAEVRARATMPDPIMLQDGE